MTMKHSPGPWAVSKLATPDYAPEFGIFRDTPDGAPALARTMNENSEANARLLAAAPDLLAALAFMLGAAETDCLDDKSNAWRSAMIDARAALAKVQP